MSVRHTELKRLVQTIFATAGCQPPEDERIAHYLVEANLVGHDSHGVIRVPPYVDFIRKDMIRLNQSIRVAFETEALAVLDGQLGFGQVIGEQAMRFAIDKADRHGIAAVGLRNCGHLGRIGDWPLMVARAGKISVHFVNSSGFGALVAPYGGIDRRLSANPIAAGIPVEGGEPIVVDMSTCTIAEGKIKVASNQGVTVPDDCLLDAEGAPTDDPARFYADPPGSILPIAGHKGYALSFLVEILAGAFTGSGCTDPARAKAMVNGMLTIVLDPERIERDWGFADEVRRYIEFVKSSRLRNADGEILLPGEPEQRTRKRRLAEGIELDETTLQQLIETARSVGVSDEAIAVDALRHD